MSNNIKVSICICTRNRPENLKQALDSLEKSTYPVFEVIVSDDSTDTETETMMAANYANVKYLPGPRKGLGANRNNALRSVTGTHVLFLDDDAVLGEQFLEIAIAHMEQEAKNQGYALEKLIVTGPQLDHGRLMFPNRPDFLGFQKIPYESGELLETVVINSAIFPRSVFETTLFDEKLVYGCDEVDFTTRAIKFGFKIVLCSEAVNLHLPSLINRDFYKPYHEASRLYVTFKRYLSTDKQHLKALLFLALASAHTTVHSLKIEGIQGISKSLKTFRLVSNYVALEYFPQR
jgi:GT2 family glycosyltransferase